tara:strand:- start:3273 stop:3806 length:534 start_codon:yes stop_codon:yes gene_type:complete
MNCEHCDNNLKVQSTRYLSGYVESLHTIFSKKGVCEDLANIIIGFLVNEKGHRIDYVRKSYRNYLFFNPLIGDPKNEEDEMWGYYHPLSYTVCSPCFQIGFEKFKNERDEWPSLRRNAYFAMDFDLGKIEDKEYEEKARKYILYYIVHDYKVDYYRNKEYTQIECNNGKTLLKIDWK